jgi:hypothetical protein
MTTMTPEDAIKAAASVARDVADGKLDPADLQAQAVAELRELVGTVIGPDDPAWPLQCDIARQVLALGGLTADELSEWAAVFGHRAGEPLPAAVAEPEPDDLYKPDAAELAEQPEPPAPEPVEQPEPERRSHGHTYDPLAGWDAGQRGCLG